MARAVVSNPVIGVTLDQLDLAKWKGLMCIDTVPPGYYTADYLAKNVFKLSKRRVNNLLSAGIKAGKVSMKKFKVSVACGNAAVRAIPTPHYKLL